ncbi:piggyBac transposable element-derived protein 4-like [Clytia hemisphaerica]|uniref:piggyBac transposable element-derived protein 4-like n=1 Tax=Clytia hemisphaerica TaxID=252671 RepID=UPI0034D57B26
MFLANLSIECSVNLHEEEESQSQPTSTTTSSENYIASTSNEQTVADDVYKENIQSVVKTTSTRSKRDVVEERKTYPKRQRKPLTTEYFAATNPNDSDEYSDVCSPSSPVKKKKVEKDITTKKEPKATNPKRNTATKPKQPCEPQIENYKSCDDVDSKLNTVKNFAPSRNPGPQLNGNQLRGLKTAFDFFSLFFDKNIISKIVRHTNEYGHMTIHGKSTYAGKDGEWVETSKEEIKTLIALLVYQGLVKVSTLKSYWSTKSLYHGLWARIMMGRDRFNALMSIIHIVDPATENKADKLRKVSGFADLIKEKCKELYHPYKNVAIDERIVKSKHRSGIRQYIKNKPVKFGLKLWVLADSRNGYTIDFNVYAGKNGNQPIHENGLGYHVVTKLMTPFYGQGYHLFTDNFYSSCDLFSDLFDESIYCCGTTTENRKGFPVSMKGGKFWMKKKPRGDMRWSRDKPNLALQWKDNKAVTMLSTIHNANEFVMVKRKEKVEDKWESIDVKQPKVISEYKSYMNGVDKSDQILSSNNLLRKCLRWWKTLFFHLIDIAIVNSFILFQELRKQGKLGDVKRPKDYSLLHFREELVRNILGIPEFADPPIYKLLTPTERKVPITHIPDFTSSRRNCH